MSDESTWSEERLIEALRQLDPIGAEAHNAEVEVDVERILAATHHGRRRRLRRWSLLVVGGLAIGAAGTAAALQLLEQQPNSAVGVVGCRTGLSLDASDTYVIETRDDAVAACANLWRDGALPDIDDPRTNGPYGVPALAACLVDGTVNVFPGDPNAACQTLGLQPADTALSATNRAIVAIGDRLLDSADATECPSRAEAVNLASETLGENELSNWTIREEAPQRAEDICWDVLLSPDSPELLVLPGPRP